MLRKLFPATLVTPFCVGAIRAASTAANQAPKKVSSAGRGVRVGTPRARAAGTGKARASKPASASTKPRLPVVEENTNTTSKLLIDRFPVLAAEYSLKNDDPLSRVSMHSPMGALWTCTICEHEWKEPVFVRTAVRSGCPQCSQVGKKKLTAVAGGLLMREWDKLRNDPFLRPESLDSSCTQAVLWECECCKGGFRARVASRVKNPFAQCPTCSPAKLRSFHLLKMWSHRPDDEDVVQVNCARGSKKTEIEFTCKNKMCKAIHTLSVDAALEGCPTCSK